MAILFAAFYIYDSFNERRPEGPTPWLFGVGLLLGYVSLVRYLDWIPLMTWIGLDLLRQKKFKGLVLVFLGFGLIASFNLLYDTLVTGNAFLTPAAHDARGNIQARLALQWEGLEVTAVRLLRVLYAFPPAVLLLLCLKQPRQSSRLKIYLALFTLNVSVYFVYAWAPGGPGPRYYSPYFPFLFLAVIEAYRLKREQSIARTGWRLAIACLIFCSVQYAAVQTLEIYRRRDLERTVATIPQAKKIILLETGTYNMDIPDLIRNPLDLWSAETLYLDYRDRAGIDDLLKRFPGHSVYSYRYPGSLRPGKE
jgi:hypothetical protein